MALELQEERRQRQQHPRLLECLHLADKGQIVAKDDALRQHTRFPSRRAVQSFVNSLQDLRNNLAHANDISGDWEIIVDLAANLHRAVLGPATIDEPNCVDANDSTGGTQQSVQPTGVSQQLSFDSLHKEP